MMLDFFASSRSSPGAPAGTNGPTPPKDRRLDTRATEVHPNRSLVESLASTHFNRDLLQCPIRVGWRVRMLSEISRRHQM